MSTSIAAASGTFKLGGDLEVNRLGYGTMQLTGEGVWGEPDDPDEAIAELAAQGREPRAGGGHVAGEPVAQQASAGGGPCLDRREVTVGDADVSP